MSHLGWDGGDCKLIAPRMGAGRMLNLVRLAPQSLAGNHSVLHPMPPPIHWAFCWQA